MKEDFTLPLRCSTPKKTGHLGSFLMPFWSAVDEDEKKKNRFAMRRVGPKKDDEIC